MILWLIRILLWLVIRIISILSLTGHRTVLRTLFPAGPGISVLICSAILRILAVLTVSSTAPVTILIAPDCLSGRTAVFRLFCCMISTYRLSPAFVIRFIGCCLCPVLHICGSTDIFPVILILIRVLTGTFLAVRSVLAFLILRIHPVIGTCCLWICRLCITLRCCLFLWLYRCLRRRLFYLLLISLFSFFFSKHRFPWIPCFHFSGLPSLCICVRSHFFRRFCHLCLFRCYILLCRFCRYCCFLCCSFLILFSICHFSSLRFLNDCLLIFFRFRSRHFPFITHRFSPCPLSVFLFFFASCVSVYHIRKLC